MNRLLLALGVLAAGAFLIPDTADAQRGRGGGIRIGGGGFGGGSGFRGGGFGGGSRMFIPRGGMGGPRVGMGGGFRSGAIAARPGVPGRVAGISPGTGGFRQAAINNPGSRFDTRFGNRVNWRYGGRYPYYGRYYGRYPYYGGYYPYYGGWGWGAGLVAGSVIGAAASAYPYYTDPYYTDPYSTYQTPVSSAVGGYCATSVRTCALTSAAPVGTACSCRTSGGRARGTVVAAY
jgi:hypothetical protein